MTKDLGGISGSREPDPSCTGGSGPAGFDPGREQWCAADLALVIEGLFSEATDNRCTCGSSPEDYCRYCGAWAGALRDTKKLLEQALGEAA